MISVVIPAYNEGRYIYQTLAQLGSIIKDSDIEVIVIDNGSDDETAKICRQFNWVQLVKLNNRVNVSEARNIGVRASKGDCLVFLDADIIVTEQWFKALIAFSKKIKIFSMQITGHKVCIAQEPSWIEQYWFSCLKGGAAYINSGNLICSRSAFDILGGFDKALKTGEDVDFCNRAKSNEVDVIIDPNFFVYHEGYPKDIKSFFLRERWHGIGDVQSLEKFVKSKVAIVSFSVVLISVLSLVMLTLHSYSFAIFGLAMAFMINLIVLIKRLKITSFFQFFAAMFLNYVYFIARFMSMFSQISKRTR